jgi:hypothetical protein
MKKKGRIIEREIQECLERSNTQLYRLRSIQTATKKRRALKRAASNPALTESIQRVQKKGLHEHSPTQASS